MAPAAALPADAQDMIGLRSFGPGLNAVVVGASGGIGGAFTRILAGHERVDNVVALGRSAPSGVTGVTYLATDLEDEGTIGRAAAEVGQRERPLDLVLVASGMLHDRQAQPEKTWRTLDPAALDRLFRVNTIGPALVAKHFLPLLARDRKTVFAALSARVGSITDNHLGGWYGYRASKAALNMMIKTLAIELARRNRAAVCVGLHPGTVDTGLSAPFQGGVPDDRLFTPAFAATRLLAVVDHLQPADSGGLFAWDGARIPF